MKKRVPIQNIKPTQILDLKKTMYLKGGEDDTDIIIEDTVEL